MTAGYEQKILNELLDKYERSKAYTENSGNARVILKPMGDERLMEELEDPEQKALFLDALDQLSRDGLIRFSWMRHEKGNLIDSIHLVLDPVCIKESYRRTGRTAKAERVHELMEDIQDVLSSGHLERGGPIESFLLGQKHQLQEKKSISRFFFDTDEKKEKRKEEDAAALNRNLLKVLCAMDENRMRQHGDCMERVLSAGLFGDSKYFERQLKPRVFSILRAIVPDREDLPPDEELLGEYGIVRWPEIFEMTGDLTAVRKDGRRIAYSSEPSGAYINSITVRELDHVEAEAVRKILFIENKANYVWYSLYQRKPEELVLYHGGCFSPSKKMWFQMVLDAALPETEVLHWSDIDIGGFRIFTRLRREIAPAALPWRMDVETLRQYDERTMPITDQRYLDGLKRLLDDPEYEIFHEVIRYMIRRRVRLEQEQLILPN